MVKTIFAVAAISMFVILFGFIAIAPTNAFADIEFEEKEFTQKYAPDRLLIKFKNDVSESHKKQIIHRNSGLISDEIPQIKVKIIQVPTHALEKIQTALSKHFAVEYVEKDYLFEPEMIPNDPTYPSQYHLPTIQADAAWDITQGDASIPIAILDSGVDPTHPDLAGKLQNGYNFYNDNDDWTDTNNCGHGTKVAGAAAAISNNGIGVAGVAWDNPIIPIKITDSNCYGYYSTMIKGIIYAADNGAKVANISYRIYAGDPLTDAAKYMHDKGGWVVAAGGNTGVFANYADNPYIISVGATYSNDQATSFSTYGPYIDFTAPGSGIYTTRNGGTYGASSGTSFSSPIVAGAIGLIASADPSLSADEIYDVLKLSAVDLGAPGRDDVYGWGRINVSQALQIIDLPVDTEPPVISGMPDNITIDTDVPSGIVVTWSEPTATDNVGVTSFDSTHNSGDTFPVGSTTVTYTASDDAGNSADSSFTITVTFTAPPPVDTITDYAALNILSNGSQDFKCTNRVTLSGGQAVSLIDSDAATCTVDRIKEDKLKQTVRSTAETDLITFYRRIGLSC